METVRDDQYVVIGIGREKFGLKVKEIHEIIKMQPITEIPSSKPHIRGVTNLRGLIVPIVSLRFRFGLPEEPYTRASRIVVLNHRGERVGVIVDHVAEVTRFAAVQPADGVNGGAGERQLEGIGHTSEGIVSILRIDSVLSD